jgi:cyclopropane fatty-acyl-phospholipid synthase-like methyltransferase
MVIKVDIDSILAKGWIPDSILRFFIRRLLAKKIKNQRISDIEKRQKELLAFIEDLKTQAIAVQTREANEQHYELPPEFFEKILGENLKYSCCLWPEDHIKEELPPYLNQAEEDMLELSCRRAELEDGQKILELGCGWGSMTLHMADKFPNSKITAISNSRFQIEYINELAKNRGIKNIEVKVADINNYYTEEKFDRIISIEMFEHMRNYQKLMKKISGFLRKEGKLFIHIFTHHTYPFTYHDRSSSDWMARYFFSGGTMPSQNLIHYFTAGLNLEKQWAVSGCHYRKTLEAWLINMDEKKKEIWPIFVDTYGQDNAQKWWNYWRLFFISTAEFFGYNKGNEWFVSHYLFKRV